MAEPSAIGPYRLDEALAESHGMTAHRATRAGIEGFEKAVVVWRIASDLEAPGAVIARAQRCASLRHSDVAQVLDAGPDEDGSYVVTEYVAGASLAEVARARPVSWALLLHIGAHVANGLDHAHTRRDGEGRLLHIVHRGVSADRVLLSTSGDVKLTGFGLPTGASPAAVLDGRGDVFDLAVTLERLMPKDAPREIHQILSMAQRELPEDRPRAAAMRHAFRRLLHDRHQRASSLTLGRLVAGALARPNDVTPEQTLVELERQVRDMDPFADLDHALATYEALGQRLVDESAGARGLPFVIAGLDLAESVGRDDHAARMCMLLSQLCAQAGRLDESLEWRTRASWAQAS